MGRGGGGDTTHNNSTHEKGFRRMWDIFHQENFVERGNESCKLRACLHMFVEFTYSYFMFSYYFVCLVSGPFHYFW